MTWVYDRHYLLWTDCVSGELIRSESMKLCVTLELVNCMTMFPVVHVDVPKTSISFGNDQVVFP